MISITQGDTAVFNLTAQDGGGNPVNLTGAVFTSYIKGENGVVLTFPNPQHAIISAPDGQYTLSLSSTDTMNCGLGSNKQIITRIVQGASTIYFQGVNILIVNAAVPLQ